MMPICWKCSDSVLRDVDGTHNVLVGCKGNCEIECYEDAKVLCPLTMPEWNIEPCDTPKGCEKNWGGQWFRFEKMTDLGNYGHAHCSKLHLYVGEKLAKQTLTKHGVVV